MNGLKTTFAIAGLSIGSSMIGDALGSSGLQSAGATGATFISPAINITMGGKIVGMLKDFKKL